MREEPRTRTDDASLEVRRLEEATDLTAACETLAPRARDHFTRSFDSFDEYAAWKNAQINPWHR